MKTNYFTQSNELVSHLIDRNVEAFALFADVNRKVLEELASLGVAATKDGSKLYADIQAGLVEATREGQSFVTQTQALVAEGPADPLSWSQRAFLLTAEGIGRTFKLLESNTQAVTKTAEQIQGNVERASKQVQESLATYTNKLQELYTPKN